MVKSLRPDLSKILSELPPIVPRKDISTILGGIITKGYMQNLDCEGKGPRRIKIGKRVGYLREDLVAWLEDRAEIIG